MSEYLYDKLTNYTGTDAYPMHMPGHKRQRLCDFNPYDLDITEIDGFDYLHDARGVIRESEERAAKLFGTDHTFFMVNGTTGGMLSALWAVTNPGAKVALARNSHRCAYNAAIVSKLNVRYIYTNSANNLCTGINPEDIKDLMDADSDIKCVVIVSPTYEGVVSDVESIAGIVHDRGGILIVDEAHGAHFPFGHSFPRSATECGADIVLHSAHKTLPAFTQSALLHVKRDRVDADRVRDALAVFQSSSPSYILMAGLDKCMDFLEKEGEAAFEEYEKRLSELRKNLSGLKALRLLGKDDFGDTAFDYDPGKIVIKTDRTGMTGPALMERLRRDYDIECEMAGIDYIIAMTSVSDTGEGFDRLQKALNETDKSAENISENKRTTACEEAAPTGNLRVTVKEPMYEAISRDMEFVSISSAEGRESGEFLYVYPPGIPIVTPGEIITEGIISEMERYRTGGLEISGGARTGDGLIKVVI